MENKMLSPHKELSDTLEHADSSLKVNYCGWLFDQSWTSLCLAVCVLTTSWSLILESLETLIQE